ncbi:MAG: hypothetical protein R2729_18270 [Bryobacteraceae bacterium]
MGQIITFYSYKGGTGRTMALANMAWLLASNGNRVLMADWDLEAPGLHRYFAPFLTDRGLEKTPGVIDVMVDFARQAVTPGERPDTWYKKLAQIDRMAVAINWRFPTVTDSRGNESRGYLEFIPAGQQTATYATRVNSFNWDNFYERLGGGEFINEIRKNLRDSYDYVLIDSRTGVSDTSGICTVQLPDKVVVCFTLNNQSIEGASVAARAILEQHGGAAKRFPVFPVPTRVDYSEDDRLNLRRDYAQRRFRKFLTFLPSGVTQEQYWNEVEVPYRALYAYEELLTPFGDKPGDPKSMLAAFERMARYVTGTEQRLKEMDFTEQERVRREFAVIPISADSITAERAMPAMPPPAPVAAEDPVYFSFHTGDGDMVQTVRDRLRSSGHDGVAGTTFENGRWGEEVPRRLGEARRFVYFVGPRGLSAWQRRELAFAAAEWRQARAAGRSFEIVAVILPHAHSGDLPTEFLRPNTVDFRSGLDARAAWEKLNRLMIEDSGSAAPLPAGSPFEEEDAAVLPNRDAEVLELARLVGGRERVVRLRGDTGCGKTSLIEAGLIPYLRRQAKPRWEVVSFRPGSDPFVAFAEAAQPLLRGGASSDPVSTTLQYGTSLATGTLTIHSFLQLALRQSPGAQLLLVIDQAEELFTHTQSKQRDRFLAALEAIPPDLPLTVLVATRPDWEWRAEQAAPRLATAPGMILPAAGPGRLDRRWARRVEEGGAEVRKQTVVDEALDSVLDGQKEQRLSALSRLSGGDVRVRDLPDNVIRTLDPFLANGLVSAHAASDPKDNTLHLEGEGQALWDFTMANNAALAWRAEALRSLQAGVDPPTVLSKEWYRFLDPAEIERWRIQEEVSSDPAATQTIPLSTKPVVSLPEPDRAQWWRSPWAIAAAVAIPLLLAAAIHFVQDHFLPGPPPLEVTSEMARKAFAAGAYQEAIKATDEWIQKDPTAEAYSLRAQSHWVRGELANAEEDFTNALGLDPRNARYFAMRAAVRADLNKTDEAAKDAVEAVTLDPAMRNDEEISKREVLARAVRQTTVPVAGNVPRVFGHVAFEAQKDELRKALEALRTRGYRPETGIEVVGEKAPVRSEVRYFRKDWEDKATELADLLASLGVPARPVFAGSRDGAPETLEIWMAARGQPSPVQQMAPGKY